MSKTSKPKAKGNLKKIGRMRRMSKTTGMNKTKVTSESGKARKAKNTKKARYNNKNSPLVLVTNHAGSFCLNAKGQPTSRYHGLFFWLGDHMYRTVALFDHHESGSMHTDGFRATQTFPSLVASWCFAREIPVFFYDLDNESSFDIVLDCKENYDNRFWGRTYSVEQIGEGVLVKYVKRDDVREPSGREYEFWLVFLGASDLVRADKWELQEYPDDFARQSPPGQRWVYRLGRVTAKNIVVACAHDRDVALKDARDARAQKGALTRHTPVLHQQQELLEAYHFAAQSLLSLRAGGGLFAGLPWFHQRWLRDEIISARALLLLGDKRLTKDIVLYWLAQMDDDGRFPGTLSSTIADGAWVFVRARELYEWGLLSRQDVGLVKQKLELFARALDDLALNRAGETWMDAVYQGDARAGARIEVNALMLAALAFARKLDIDVEIEEYEARAREVFWNGRYLQDGEEDDMIRPNLFIAAYVYPGLLSKQQWMKCFDAVLPRLWLKWGGLSSIDTAHTLFREEHTGEDPASYHRGDSWFWVNNLAAIVLYRTSPKKYQHYINAILEASKTEILELGARGHHAELSSASKLSAQGCFAQAWSAALFVELVRELGLVLKQ